MIQSNLSVHFDFPLRAGQYFYYISDGYIKRDQIYSAKYQVFDKIKDTPSITFVFRGIANQKDFDREDINKTVFLSLDAAMEWMRKSVEQAKEKYNEK
jgi:hypothetical protein